jgi:hypothetical protein
MDAQALQRPCQEQSDELVDQVVDQIGRWRLTVPSLMLLDVVKPFGFIASQGLLLCQPFLSFFGIEQQVSDYAGLLADREGIDRLVIRLEQELPIRGTNDKEED